MTLIVSTTLLILPWLSPILTTNATFAFVLLILNERTAAVHSRIIEVLLEAVIDSPRRGSRDRLQQPTVTLRTIQMQAKNEKQCEIAKLIHFFLIECSRLGTLKLMTIVDKLQRKKTYL